MSRTAAAASASAGQIIGHTHSGKPVYDRAAHPAHESFSAADHGWAAVLHAELAWELESHRLGRWATDEHARVRAYHLSQQGAHNLRQRDLGREALARVDVAGEVVR